MRTAARRCRAVRVGRTAGRGAGRGTAAQALVEIALVIPLLLVIMCAALEFGLMAADVISLTNAARDGARAGADAGYTQAQAEAAAQAAVSVSATGLLSCALSPAAAAYGGDPPHVSVTASCVYSPVTPLGPLLAAFLGGGPGGSITLSHSADWRVQQ